MHTWKMAEQQMEIRANWLRETLVNTTKGLAYWGYGGLDRKNILLQGDTTNRRDLELVTYIKLVC